ncbi:selenocysteine-specific translation elongation factor [Lampropedia aestuarii]|uniref:selenocysteine-specific translation elongation factor n=1 Tax=Lampropedia aestuarii TaxID=2562762 RepID=UPI002469C282|nr:selenocysteine-specific translation elongation factor [Lampropedia aestuarii]MDH5856362.1 selenocysteine-specific translation elongation factor [Lampropedia aestuarii]
MIIGTAGHIDHGKTTLVRALTGVDTDRLKEEKARGISIELGYAYIPVPETQDILGFIDVPGHEKFIHTMAAGAVGIDHALLVVAADDGIMPQTQEHLAIIALLGVQHGTVALTKADRVSPERLEQVQRAIEQLLGNTPLATAPIFATNAAQAGDAGTLALREHLLTLARHFPARPQQGLFRLAVDRAFSLQGQGTVVTGTVFGGQVHVGEQLQHSGTGQMVRVRSIHAQNQAAPSGYAGQRVALNLAGIDKEAIARGDWIAQPLALQATRRLDVRLSVLPQNVLPAAAQHGKHAPNTLQQWSTVHLHIGTSHHIAHVVPLDCEHLSPGEQGLAQLVLDADVYAVAGDHFIVRNAQASHTLAGGTVLDPYPPERKRRSTERIAYLQAMHHALASGDVSELIAHAAWGISRLQLARLMGWAPEQITTPKGVVVLGKNTQDTDPILLSQRHWQALQQQVLHALQRFHERNPDEPGVNAARLRRIGLPGLSHSKYDLLWQGVLNSLVEGGSIHQSGPWLHAPGHSVQLSAAEEQLAQQMLPDLEDGQFEPPWVRDLARDHGVAEDTVRALLRKLSRQGRLHQVVKDLFYTPTAIERLQAIASTIAQQSPQLAIEARHFRDATALGRKRAIQVLEYFDRSGFTRRVRDSHVLRNTP